jgi:hypothetical protein
MSPADLHSLHCFLLARHEVNDFDDYTHLLALFRNTRALEAHNACQRYTELDEASRSIETVRQAIIQQLKVRHSRP